MSHPGEEELLRELLEAFVAEASDLLRSLSEHLLALENSADPEETARLLEQIFRDAHTLKGSAAVVNLGAVRTLAHRLETVFARMQRGERTPPASFDLVYQALDAIGLLVEEAATGTPAHVDAAALASALDSAGEPARGAGNGGELVEAASGSGGKPTGEPGAQAEGEASTDSRPPGMEPLPAPPHAREETVRIATSKLDALMARVGELLTAGAASEQRLSELKALADELSGWQALWRKTRRLRRRIARTASGQSPGLRAAALRDVAALAAFLDAGEEGLAAFTAGIDEVARATAAGTRRVAQITAGVQAEVRSARMLPISTVLDAFPRMVRDLARERGKELRLEIRGEDTELDRAVLEQIKGPLTHLLRNAIDHGIESPEERVRSGKPRVGSVTLAASQRGATVLVEVSDDGAGIDPERVKASAVGGGILSAEEAALLGDREAIRLIFQSGFSTSPVVTHLSGRGVGLDAVRESAQRLHGTVDVVSAPGRRTTFALGLPLTVSTTGCLLVEEGGQILALPVTNVLRIVRLEPGDIRQAEGSEAVRVGGEPLPLVRLAHLVGSPPSAPDEGRMPAVILGSAERRGACLVRGLVGVRDLVVTGLPAPLPRVPNAAGAAVLGTGEVVVVLDAADLMRGSAPREAVAPNGGAPPRAEERIVLIADDSITTRTLERNILRGAGYRVRVAADGIEAWGLLQSDGADLVVTDVRMPRMDGLELTRKIRSEERFKRLPVVLVTSLESPTDRERGVEAGADAYVVKSTFDQERLLEIVRRLI